VNISDFGFFAEDWLLDDCCLVISEFMASNHSVLKDEDGDYPDWIELYNPSTRDVNLDGFFLTDKADNLTKWCFPNVQIKAWDFLILFASGKNRSIPGQPLHTNFRLDKDGEYLALVSPDGEHIVDEYLPKFVAQYEDISYGLSQVSSTLVGAENSARYYVPTDDSWENLWMEEGFDDSGWNIGQVSFTFGVGPGTDIVGYWNLDEAEGTAVFDQSGYGHDGTCEEGLELGENSVEGVIGNALNFDGIDDHIEIADSNDLTPNHITVAFWIKPTDLGAGLQNVISKKDENNNGSYVIEIEGLSVNNLFNLDGSWINLELSFAEDEWQHVALTYDGSFLRGYINAQPSGNEVAAVGNVNNDPGSLYLGGTPVVGSYFSGALDEIRIYNRALGPDEISLLYASSGIGEEGEIKEEMHGNNSSVWLRSEFEVADCNAIDKLLLKIKYEDGFAAYLNGRLIASRNAPTLLQWDCSAVEDFLIPPAWTSEPILIPEGRNLLHNGTNVLAIHGLNDDANNSDFLLEPELISLQTNYETYYFNTPTPGIANEGGSVGVVGGTEFNINRGFYTDGFDLMISTDTPGAEIYYTTNNLSPSPTNPAASFYDGPVHIDRTTVVRAAAFKDGYVPSNVETHTYIFASDVSEQSMMWTEITQHEVWRAQMEEALLSIPTISLVVENAISQIEQETSIELLFEDGTEGFGVYAGIEYFGGYGLRHYAKKSMRISFKRVYGPARLHYDLFGIDATRIFDQILLRAGSNDSMFYIDPTGTRGSFIRNRWAFDRQLEMGQPAPHGRFVHVYINGEYWGQYHLMERPNGAFMASYFGGDKEDYDALNAGVAVDGDTIAWNAMVDSTDDYSLLQEYMDVVNYADYMLLEFYSGNDFDWWVDRNWMAARRRQSWAGYKFFAWDSDLKLRRSVYANVIDAGGPGDMWNSIKQHEEFRMLLADRAQQYFFNNGILTPDQVSEDVAELTEQMDKSIIAECARWGYRGDGNYNPNTWQRAVDWIRTEYIPQRTDIVIQQMRDAGVFPLIDAPVFKFGSVCQHGGHIPVDAGLSMVHVNGGVSAPILYTLNGADPRLPGGEIFFDAIEYDGPVILTADTHVMARTWDNGQWSALNKAFYTVGEAVLDFDLQMENLWMYQNLPGSSSSILTATVANINDNYSNSSYTYDWEIILPDDVTVAPAITGGGGPADPCCTFAAPSCNEPNGISDSGQAFTLRVTVTGADFGNRGIAEAEFGVALLGDVNNDTAVNIADRSIINTFWRTGAAGGFTLRDCDINCDDSVSIADSSITNAIWQGVLGQNRVSSPCPLR
jgi:hypothetical protein